MNFLKACVGLHLLAISISVLAAEPIVICTSESGGGWKLAAKGSFIRTVIGNRTDYEIDTPQQKFSWFDISKPGGTMIMTPSRLTPVFSPHPKKPRAFKSPRGPLNIAGAIDFEYASLRQNIAVSGEIWEVDGDKELIATRGTVCPPAHLGWRPTETLERDVRKKTPGP